MLSLASLSNPSFNPSFDLPSLTPQSARTLSLIILSLYAISNAPTTNAMNQFERHACIKSCYQKFLPDDQALDQCVQNCWNAFVSTQ